MYDLNYNKLKYTIINETKVNRILNNKKQNAQANFLVWKKAGKSKNYDPVDWQSGLQQSIMHFGFPLVTLISVNVCYICKQTE